MKNQYKIPLVVTLIVVLVVGVITLLMPHDKSKVAYSCYHKDGSTYVRCLASDNRQGCYGYYDLIENRPEDGIKIVSSMGSTCEGFIDGRQLYFDQNGKYIR